MGNYHINLSDAAVLRRVKIAKESEDGICDFKVTKAEMNFQVKVYKSTQKPEGFTEEKIFSKDDYFFSIKRTD
jgi:hypothetical protein